MPRISSLLEASENECRVRTAEAETVRERVLHKRLARFVRHIIQVAFRVGSVVVNRRGQFPPVDGERGEDGFYSARRAEQMTRHRLRGTERQLTSMRAESLLDGKRLAPVAERSGSAMRVDVADLLRTDARILNCPPHRAAYAALRVVGRGHMVSVGGRAVADDLGVDMRAALAGVFQFFEDHDPRAFTDHKPVAVAIEGA